MNKEKENTKDKHFMDTTTTTATEEATEENNNQTQEKNSQEEVLCDDVENDSPSEEKCNTEAHQNTEKQDNIIETLNKENAELKDKYLRLAKENAELKDKYLRLAAEFDNYRKRTIKEKMDMVKSASKDVLINMLPIMDDFERALQSIAQTDEKETLQQGVELIYNKMRTLLMQQGIKEIEAMHEPFNTDFHEAVTKVPASEEQLKGKVLDVVQKGYMLHDSVLRYCKVVVGE